MAITVIPLGIITGNALRIINDTDADNTSENNVNDGPATVYSVVIDNTANGAVSYIKLYDAAAPTVGTTAPTLILPVAASVNRTYAFKNGVAFATALSVAGVTAGGTAGTTSPTSNVLVSIVVA